MRYFNEYGPWGRQGGESWSDGTYSGIRAITIFTNDQTLLSIQVTYGLKGDQDLSVEAARHGGNAGTKKIIHFNYPEEKLEKISGYHGDYAGYYILKSLTFYTNERQLGPFGTEGGYHFESPSNVRDTVGFYGRSSANLIDNIGFYSLVPDAPVPSASVANWDAKFYKYGPWGRDGGAGWTDGTYTGIKGITIFTNDQTLLSIQVTYGLKGGRDFSVEAARHGGNAGAKEMIYFNYPDERLEKISGYHGDYAGYYVLKSLTFYTNQRQLGPYGKEGGYYFESPSRQNIVGFYGRASANLIDNIGIYTLV
eukprot:Gb_20108 [translate_table: standard]